jgi:LAGLIDADG endonuclease
MLDNGRSVNLQRQQGRAPGGDALIEARLAATPPLDWADGHAFAGFVEAEACFSLVQSNDRRSWRCACAIKQRDDDAAVLAEFQSLTGIGSLSQVRAAGGSAPQVCWTISSRLECSRLVEILTAFPLRGRKAFEFSIWSAALDALSEASPRRRLSRPLVVTVERAAEQLHFLRRYVDPPRHLPVWSWSEPGLIPYIGGFFTGEGSFQLARQSARITEATE